MLVDSLQDQLKLNSLAMYVCCHKEAVNFKVLPIDATVRRCFCAHFIKQAQIYAGN